MAPSPVVDDYYQILGISQLAGRDVIRANYKKLALKHHPDRNPNNPKATAQFQMLEATYSTLFDPERRRIYDIHFASIKSRYPRNHDADKNDSPPQANEGGSKAAQKYKLQIEKLEAALEGLRKRRRELEKELLNAKREHNSCQTALNKLQADADKNTQEEIDRNSWLGYFFSARQSEEEKQARQRRMVDNRAARSVREAELKGRTSRIATAQLSLDTLNGNIQDRTLEKGRLQQEAARLAEAERQEAARMAYLRRQQAMQEERQAKAREEAERIRKEQLAERVRKEHEAERLRRAQEARKAEEERLRKHREEIQEEIRSKAREKAESILMEQLEELVRKEREAEWMRKQDAGEAEGKRVRKQREEARKKNPNTAKDAKTSGERTQRGKGINTENTLHGKSARASAGRASSCLHRSWWDKEEGRHLCERCLTTTSRYAFRCPTCRIVTCAGCRDILKGRV
ncbi:hypothetical protein V8C42DRAFT_318916 [Trichoderma barbatum]